MKTRELHLRFLNMELKAETENFEKKFSASALSLLNDMEEMFLGQFLKFENGEMVVKFKSSRAFPRKGEYLQAMYLPSKMQNYKSWGDWSYEYIFKKRIKGTEAVCVWQSKSLDDNFILAGFRSIDVDFAQYISRAPGALIVFGPNRPPIDYLVNLCRLVNDSYNLEISEILDFDYRQIENAPKLLKKDKVLDFIYKQMSLSNITILQGPPGTGKTRLIAELCARFCAEGKSVLVTAFTNQALMEIAKKKACEILLKQKCILKSNLTVDEQKELPQIEEIKQILPISGALTMATYYVVSGYAAESLGLTFDIVIMDEASQALTAMFAASKKIGRSNLWVGDIAQMGPMVALNGDRIAKNDFYDFINGLVLLSTKRILPLFQLTETYRLTKRGADYTGFFYKGTLCSGNRNKPRVISSLDKILNREGGPSLVLTDMEIGDATPLFAIDLVTIIAFSLIRELPQAEIAILSCFKKTTRALQKAVTVRLGLKSKILVETIARIQGITTDFTILLIPNVSLLRSLEKHLFNVATSRAKEHTIIVADKGILTYTSMDVDVRAFLSKLSLEQCLYIPNQMLVGNNINLLI